MKARLKNLLVDLLLERFALLAGEDEDPARAIAKEGA